MGEAKKGTGPTLFSANHQRDRKTRSHVTRGYKFRPPTPPAYTSSSALPLVEPDARPIESSGRAAGVFSKRQGGHLLLVTWLVEKVGMEQCKAEPCVFRKIIKKEVSLMVGVHVDDT